MGDNQETSSVQKRMLKAYGAVMAVKVSLNQKVFIGYFLVFCVTLFAGYRLLTDYNAFRSRRDAIEEVNMVLLQKAAEMDGLLQGGSLTPAARSRVKDLALQIEDLAADARHGVPPLPWFDRVLGPTFARFPLFFPEWFKMPQVNEQRGVRLASDLARGAPSESPAALRAPLQELMAEEAKLIQVKRTHADYKGKWIWLLAWELFAGGCLLIFAGLVFTRIFIINPVRELTGATQEIAQGDLERKVQIVTGDEFGVLAHRFNQMTSALRETILYQKEQIEKLLSVVEQARRGDLRHKVSIDTDDEFAHLGAAFNTMTENLANLVRQIERAVAEVTSASTQILAATEEQASGVAEQSAQINEVAASVEELTITAKQIAEMAFSVAAAAEDAQQAALFGAGAMRDSVQAMSDIRDTVQMTASDVGELGQKSGEIGKVVEEISRIAEQINLLALNAAIEAARAGEAGKGFAVVADEVRKLAERSATATDNINQSITSVQQQVQNTVLSMEMGTKKVEKGMELIRRGEQALEAITTAVNTTAQKGKEINRATEEQTKGSQMVSAAMESLRQVVKQTETTARQTKRSAEDLSRLANDLKVQVSGLQVGGQE